MLRPDLPLIHDEEGAAVPRGLPVVVDAHVHVFPQEIFAAVRNWFDELSAYRELIEKYDTLWLDTTMVLTDYFPLQQEVDLKRYRLDRVMYGSDFPNIPFAWDRELKRLLRSGLSDAELEWVASKSACGFFGLGFLQG